MIMWLAWKLPRSLVYWCAVRVMAHATTVPDKPLAGVLRQCPIVPELSIIDALDRWEQA